MQKYLDEALAALRSLQRQIRWKPGKDLQHLEKRKALGHLPEDFQMEDYNELIVSLLRKSTNTVYLYRFGQERYYAVRGLALGVP